ncbi:MAG: ankyrin repeat domain-containing protein [Bdellovibrionales bacterium]|nr:ankyrin repeat domain-containing protein [Bdellovibrionales bacterium]
MKKAFAWGWVVFLLSASQSFGSVVPNKSCTVPTGNPGALFDLIANPKTQPADIQVFLKSKVVPLQAVNAFCEPPAFFALRTGRRDLFNELQNSNFKVSLLSTAKVSFATVYPAFSQYSLLDYLWLFGDMVTIFENVGPNPTQFDGLYSAPYLAASGNRLEVLEFLFAAHPVIASYTRDQWADLLATSCKSEDRRVALHVLTYAGSTHVSSSVSPIHVCAQMGREDMVRELVRSGADPLRTFGSERLTVMGAAMKEDRVAVIQALLELGVSPNQKVANSISGFVDAELYPLNFAVRNGSVDSVALLLRSGATFVEYSTRTTKTYTPNMTLAAATVVKVTDPVKAAAILDVLGSQKVSMNATSSSSVGALEALLIYADKMDLNLLEKILRLGGNPNQKRANASQSTDTVFAYFLQNANPIPENQFNLLLKVGQANPNTQVSSSSRGTMLAHLYVLTQKKNINIVKALIQAGAQVDAKENYWGYTALGHAASNCDLELAKVLVDLGATKSIKMGKSTARKIAKANDCSKELVRFLR